jgi:hypothetical protein
MRGEREVAVEAYAGLSPFTDQFIRAILNSSIAVLLKCRGASAEPNSKNPILRIAASMPWQ